MITEQIHAIRKHIPIMEQITITKHKMSIKPPKIISDTITIATQISAIQPHITIIAITENTMAITEHIAIMEQEQNIEQHITTMQMVTIIQHIHIGDVANKTRQNSPITMIKSIALLAVSEQIM